MPPPGPRRGTRRRRCGRPAERHLQGWAESSTCLAGRVMRWFDVVSLGGLPGNHGRAIGVWGIWNIRPHPRRRRRLHRHDRGLDVGLSWTSGRHRGGSTGQAAVTWPGRGRAASFADRSAAGRPPRRPGGRPRPVGDPRPAGMTHGRAWRHPGGAGRRGAQRFRALAALRLSLPRQALPSSGHGDGVDFGGRAAHQRGGQVGP